MGVKLSKKLCTFRLSDDIVSRLKELSETFSLSQAEVISLLVLYSYGNKEFIQTAQTLKSLK